MTVQELIELLRYEDMDAEVHVTYSANDHWRTVLAPPVRSVDGEARIERSDYHGTDTLLDDDDCDGETYDKARQVVALRI